MNSINTEIRLHLPSNVLPYEATRNVFVEANQEALAEEGVVVLPTPSTLRNLKQRWNKRI